MKVKVIQCDNRLRSVELPDNSDSWESLSSISSYSFKRNSKHWFSTNNFFQFTTYYNKLICLKNHWEYLLDINESSQPAQYNKLKLIQNHLDSCDILIYMDTDAWISDKNQLNNLLTYFINSGRWGIFSRDPYLKNNTYINSGVIILRSNSGAMQFWNNLIEKIESRPKLLKWPFEQGIVSDEVLKKKQHFIILKPEVLNTPSGQIIRHNWFKDDTLFKTMLYDILKNTSEKSEDIANKSFNIEPLMDKESFPNTYKIKNRRILQLKDFLSKIYYSLR